MDYFGYLDIRWFAGSFYVEVETDAAFPEPPEVGKKREEIHRIITEKSQIYLILNTIEK